MVTCPRCGVAIDDGALYGPCAACRDQLRQMAPPPPDGRYGPPEPLSRVDVHRGATRPAPASIEVREEGPDLTIGRGVRS